MEWNWWSRMQGSSSHSKEPGQGKWWANLRNPIWPLPGTFWHRGRPQSFGVLPDVDLESVHVKTLEEILREKEARKLREQGKSQTCAVDGTQDTCREDLWKVQYQEKSPGHRVRLSQYNFHKEDRDEEEEEDNESEAVAMDTGESEDDEGQEIYFSPEEFCSKDHHETTSASSLQKEDIAFSQQGDTDVLQVDVEYEQSFQESDGEDTDMFDSSREDFRPEESDRSSDADADVGSDVERCPIAQVEAVLDDSDQEDVDVDDALKQDDVEVDGRGDRKFHEENELGMEDVNFSLAELFSGELEQDIDEEAKGASLEKECKVSPDQPGIVHGEPVNKEEESEVVESGSLNVDPGGDGNCFEEVKDTNDLDRIGNASCPRELQNDASQLTNDGFDDKECTTGEEDEKEVLLQNDLQMDTGYDETIQEDDKDIGLSCFPDVCCSEEPIRSINEKAICTLQEKEEYQTVRVVKEIIKVKMSFTDAEAVEMPSFQVEAGEDRNREEDAMEDAGTMNSSLDELHSERLKVNKEINVSCHKEDSKDLEPSRGVNTRADNYQQVDNCTTDTEEDNRESRRSLGESTRGDNKVVFSTDVSSSGATDKEEREEDVQVWREDDRPKETEDDNVLDENNQDVINRLERSQQDTNCLETPSDEQSQDSGPGMSFMAHDCMTHESKALSTSVQEEKTVASTTNGPVVAAPDKHQGAENAADVENVEECLPRASKDKAKTCIVDKNKLKVTNRPYTRKQKYEEMMQSGVKFLKAGQNIRGRVDAPWKDRNNKTGQGQVRNDKIGQGAKVQDKCGKEKASTSNIPKVPQMMQQTREVALSKRRGGSKKTREGVAVNSGQTKDIRVDSQVTQLMKGKSPEKVAAVLKKQGLTNQVGLTGEFSPSQQRNTRSKEREAECAMKEQSDQVGCRLKDAPCQPANSSPKDRGRDVYKRLGQAEVVDLDSEIASRPKERRQEGCVQQGQARQVGLNSPEGLSQWRNSRHNKRMEEDSMKKAQTEQFGIEPIGQEMSSKETGEEVVIEFGQTEEVELELDLKQVTRSETEGKNGMELGQTKEPDSVVALIPRKRGRPKRTVEGDSAKQGQPQKVTKHIRPKETEEEIGMELGQTNEPDSGVALIPRKRGRPKRTVDEDSAKQGQPQILSKHTRPKETEEEIGMELGQTKEPDSGVALIPRKRGRPKRTLEEDSAKQGQPQKVTKHIRPKETEDEIGMELGQTKETDSEVHLMPRRRGRPKPRVEGDSAKQGHPDAVVAVQQLSNKYSTKKGNKKLVELDSEVVAIGPRKRRRKKIWEEESIQKRQTQQMVHNSEVVQCQHPNIRPVEKEPTQEVGSGLEVALSPRRSRSTGREEGISTDQVPSKPSGPKFVVAVRQQRKRKHSERKEEDSDGKKQFRSAVEVVPMQPGKRSRKKRAKEDSLEKRQTQNIEPDAVVSPSRVTERQSKETNKEDCEMQGCTEQVGTDTEVAQSQLSKSSPRETEVNVSMKERLTDDIGSDASTDPNQQTCTCRNETPKEREDEDSQQGPTKEVGSTSPNASKQLRKSRYSESKEEDSMEEEQKVQVEPYSEIATNKRKRKLKETDGKVTVKKQKNIRKGKIPSPKYKEALDPESGSCCSLTKDSAGTEDSTSDLDKTTVLDKRVNQEEQGTDADKPEDTVPSLVTSPQSIQILVRDDRVIQELYVGGVTADQSLTQTVRLQFLDATPESDQNLAQDPEVSQWLKGILVDPAPSETGRVPYLDATPDSDANLDQTFPINLDSDGGQSAHPFYKSRRIPYLDATSDSDQSLVRDPGACQETEGEQGNQSCLRTISNPCMDATPESDQNIAQDLHEDPEEATAHQSLSEISKDPNLDATPESHHIIAQEISISHETERTTVDQSLSKPIRIPFAQILANQPRVMLHKLNFKVSIPLDCILKTRHTRRRGLPRKMSSIAKKAQKMTRGLKGMEGTWNQLGFKKPSQLIQPDSEVLSDESVSGIETHSEGPSIPGQDDESAKPISLGDSESVYNPVRNESDANYLDCPGGIVEAPEVAHIVEVVSSEGFTPTASGTVGIAGSVHDATVLSTLPPSDSASLGGLTPEARHFTCDQESFHLCTPSDEKSCDDELDNQVQIINSEYEAMGLTSSENCSNLCFASASMKVVVTTLSPSGCVDIPLVSLSSSGQSGTQQVPGHPHTLPPMQIFLSKMTESEQTSSALQTFARDLGKTLLSGDQVGGSRDTSPLDVVSDECRETSPRRENNADSTSEAGRSTCEEYVEAEEETAASRQERAPQSPESHTAEDHHEAEGSSRVDDSWHTETDAEQIQQTPVPALTSPPQVVLSPARQPPLVLSASLAASQDVPSGVPDQREENVSKNCCQNLARPEGRMTSDCVETNQSGTLSIIPAPSSPVTHQASTFRNEEQDSCNISSQFGDLTLPPLGEDFEFPEEDCLSLVCDTESFLNDLNDELTEIDRNNGDSEKRPGSPSQKRNQSQGTSYTNERLGNSGSQKGIATRSEQPPIHTVDWSEVGQHQPINRGLAGGDCSTNDLRRVIRQEPTSLNRNWTTHPSQSQGLGNTQPQPVLRNQMIPKGYCYDFVRNSHCSRRVCPYVHSKPNSATRTQMNECNMALDVHLRGQQSHAQGLEERGAAILDSEGSASPATIYETAYRLQQCSSWRDTRETLLDICQQRPEVASCRPVVQELIGKLQGSPEVLGEKFGNFVAVFKRYLVENASEPAADSLKQSLSCLGISSAALCCNNSQWGQARYILDFLYNHRFPCPAELVHNVLLIQQLLAKHQPPSPQGASSTTHDEGV